MQKRLPKWVNKELLSHLALSAMLTLGLLLPLGMLFGLENSLLMAVLIGLSLLAALSVRRMSKGLKVFVPVLAGVFVVVQLFLPSLGLIGAMVEGAKALILRFSGLEVALSMYAWQTALLLAVVVSLLSYAFCSRAAGFLPAAILVALTLFALWSMGKPQLLWYAAPALVAVLLLISQSSHEQMNIFHALPMALAAVVLALLLLPAGRITIPFLEKAATDLKQTITDYLFFTEPRNVFTLGSYGYYPLGGSQLGGEADPSEYPVMTVKTDRKTLLRAVVKDEYTGRSFRDTSSAKRYLYINPRWNSLRRTLLLEDMPSKAIRSMSSLLDEKAITIQMQNNSASTLFIPLFLRSLNTQSDMVPYFNDATELFITRDLARDDRYTVYAPVFEGGDNGLGTLVDSCVKNDSQFTSIYNQYTQLPSHLEQKVYSDVYDITKAYTTPYDKALAIQRHLQRYYRYTLSPETPPDNLDFVTYFLYKGREGYCTYFASAMTVMCRMAGLPARYVEGFMALPSSGGLAYVTGKDAHAWTEVYFEGFGWIPFDPTPSQEDQNSANPPPQSDPEPSPSPSPDPNPTPSPNPDNPNPTPSPEPQDSPDQQPEEDPETTPEVPPQDSSSSLWWLLLLLVAAVGALGWRIASRTPQKMAARKTDVRDQLFVYGSAVYTILAQAGRAPKTGETPMRFARRLDSVHASPVSITPLVRVLSLSNYSRLKPGPAQVEQVKTIYQQLFATLTPVKKLRFLFAAGFGKRCYTLLDTVVPHAQAAPAALPGPKNRSAKQTDKSASSPQKTASVQKKKRGGKKHDIIKK